MRKIVLALVIVCYSTVGVAQELKYSSEGTERVGTAVKQGSNAAMGLSMVGWGVAIAAAIAVVAILVHSDQSSQSH